MSILIRVEKVDPVEIQLILPDISKVLGKLLGLVFDPELTAGDRFEMRETLSVTYRLEPGNTDDLIGIAVKEEQAVVSVSTTPQQKFVYVSPDGWRTPLEYALAAAVVIALAEYSDSEISDSALAFTKVFSQSANDFAQRLQANKIFYNINEAADEFFVHLAMMSKP